MWSYLIVITSPGLDFLPRVGERHELVYVHTVIPQPTVERLDVPIVRGLAGAREVELPPGADRPNPRALGT